MEVYVARQPILGKNRTTYGYELLFRGGMTNAFPDIDGDTATSSVLSNSFFSIGMEQIIGGKKALINFTQELLVKKVPMIFPNKKIVVEVLEDVEPAEDVIAACKRIKDGGFDLALDDFFYKSGMEPLIELAKIIKIDFMATPIDEIREMVNQLSKYGVIFLAEKVETYEEFRQAVDMGFEYFQGYFFSRPEIMKGKDVSPSKLTLMQIVAEANKPDFSFDKLEKLISQDVSISYKLLRYINSAYFRRLQEISSIKRAIAMLGEREVRRFISLMGLAKLADDKPDELIRASVIKARLCELIGKNSANKVDASELFTLGLFSCIDAIMDDSMEHLMGNLPLSENIKSALLGKDGKLSDFINLARSYESGDWEGMQQKAKNVGIEDEKIPELYLDAVGWADTLANFQ
ncbi:putative EAL and modified HD-GYP domain-containing signal transduction protein [uncultured Desulfobacterium sp.]|uniref:Putative EAL and modified HD-GYP domain-containing signal transduction protein n=1 Tax=uncultured Desulfobacterium sp. TaxID=201089 RepID=A0A445N425_9BACT|nr:putative EAL and modified HD-GYP domain-containing signal transduction protein [uncultured Desulfobacterium sp.]